jgi:hypothetical protein
MGLFHSRESPLAKLRRVYSIVATVQGKLRTRFKNLCRLYRCSFSINQNSISDPRSSSRKHEEVNSDSDKLCKFRGRADIPANLIAMSPKSKYPKKGRLRLSQRPSHNVANRNKVKRLPYSWNTKAPREEFLGSASFQDPWGKRSVPIGPSHIVSIILWSRFEAHFAMPRSIWYPCFTPGYRMTLVGRASYKYQRIFQSGQHQLQQRLECQSAHHEVLNRSSAARHYGPRCARH